MRFVKECCCSVFVLRVFWAYEFGRFQGIVEMRRFYPVDTADMSRSNEVESHSNANGVLADL